MNPSVSFNTQLTTHAYLNDVPANQLLSALHGLLDDYRKEKSELIEFRALMINHGFKNLNHYFRANSVNATITSGDLKEKPAIELLKRDFWRQAVSLTNVMNIMPAKLKIEWAEQFEEGNQRVSENGFRSVKKYVGIPDFDETTVLPTIEGLLKDRNQFFRERVVGVFDSLSKSHLTNKPFGFSAKLILASVSDEDGEIHAIQSNYIEDLRIIVAFFHGHTNPEFNNNKSMLRCVFKTPGVWVEIDGGAIQLKGFKNGNLHISIHPEMAWKMNMVLAESLSDLIPSALRKPSEKTVKSYPLMSKTLHPGVCENLFRLVTEGKVTLHNGTHRIWVMNAFYKFESETLYCLYAIGGVLNEGKFAVEFDYDPAEALKHMGFVGVIPEKISHQFYPSPEVISRVVDDLLDYESGETLCEPEAGRGDLLRFIPADPDDVTVVEISELYCRVLRSRFSNVVKADFLEWSRSAPRFDKIVMNPPFSDGRALAHLEAASRLVKKRLVAVLPASLKDKKLLGSEYNEQWFENTFDDVFEGTAVSVAILIVEPATF